MSALENKELLLRVVTKLAAVQFKETDELMPFGATLNSRREVSLLVPKGMKQTVTTDELSTYWARELRAAAKKSDSPTVCSCCAGVLPDESGVKVSGFLIHIEHADTYSEDIFYPFWKEVDGTICFGERVVEAVDHRVFLPLT